MMIGNSSFPRDQIYLDETCRIAQCRQKEGLRPLAANLTLNLNAYLKLNFIFRAFDRFILPPTPHRTDHVPVTTRRLTHFLQIYSIIRQL